MIEAHETGLPPLRPLILHYQDDPVAPRISDQLLLGPSLLFAPVLDPETSPAPSTAEEMPTRSTYLPAGLWRDLYSAALHEGPALVNLPAPLHRLPALARANTVLPTWPPLQTTSAPRPETLYLDLYPIAGAPPRSFTLTLDDDAPAPTSFHQTYELTAAATEATLTISGEDAAYDPGHGVLHLRFRGAVAPTSVKLGDAPLPAAPDLDALASSAGYLHDPAAAILHVAFPRPEGATTVTATYPPNDPAPRTVALTLTVHLPDSTPPDAAIYLSSDLHDWKSDAVLLTRNGLTATATIHLPEPTTVRYKYTRGPWHTAESSPNCADLPNRALTALGDLGANHDHHDEIASWSDLPPCQ